MRMRSRSEYLADTQARFFSGASVGPNVSVGGR